MSKRLTRGTLRKMILQEMREMGRNRINEASPMGASQSIRWWEVSHYPDYYPGFWRDFQQHIESGRLEFGSDRYTFDGFYRIDGGPAMPMEVDSNTGSPKNAQQILAQLTGGAAPAMPPATAPMI